jgi:hypothetical protein
MMSTRAATAGRLPFIVSLDWPIHPHKRNDHAPAPAHFTHSSAGREKKASSGIRSDEEAAGRVKRILECRQPRDTTPTAALDFDRSEVRARGEHEVDLTAVVAPVEQGGVGPEGCVEKVCACCGLEKAAPDFGAVAGV